MGTDILGNYILDSLGHFLYGNTPRGVNRIGMLGTPTDIRLVFGFG